MSVSIRHQVPFHDVDSVHIVWHGHYYKYFELARTELYRSIDLDIPRMKELGYSFPVIESHCRYTHPLRYGDRFEIEARFKTWDHYIKVDYQLSDLVKGIRFANGFTKQAVCMGVSGELLLEVPESIRTSISGAL